MPRLTFHSLLISLALAANSANAQEPLPADLAFVPPNCAGFGHVRLHDVWKSDHVKEWRTTVKMAGEDALKAFDARFFPRPSTLVRATFFVPIQNSFGRDRNDEPIIVLAASKTIDKAAFMKFTVPKAKEEAVDDYAKDSMKVKEPEKVEDKAKDKGKEKMKAKGKGPDAKTGKTSGKTFLVDHSKSMAIYFVDDKTLAVGSPYSLGRMLTAPRVARGTLTEALHYANESGKPIVAALNHEIIPLSAARLLVPDEYLALTKFKLAMGSIDFEKEGHLDLRVTFGGAAEATAALDSAKEGIALGRKMLAQGRGEMEREVAGDGQPAALDDLPKAAACLAALGYINQLDDYLTKLPVKTTGNALTLSVKMPQGSQAILTSYAAVGALGWFYYRENSTRAYSEAPRPAAREVAQGARAESVNNLKQIALAMHNYHSAYNAFPAAAICDKKGKPLLSWRVAILPFIEQQKLYEEFKLDEPWDSAHNKKLIARMPQIYVVPAAPNKAGETFYRVFVGNGALFDLNKQVAINAITDGTSNTIMCVEAGQSVIWTKPDDLVYDAKKPLPKPPDFYGKQIFMGAMADGSVRAFRNDISQATMRALITRAAGDIPGKDFDN